MIEIVYQKYIKTSTRVGYALPIWKQAWVKGLKEFYSLVQIFPRALLAYKRWGPYYGACQNLLRVQCSRKDLYKTVKGPRTRPIVISLVTLYVLSKILEVTYLFLKHFSTFSSYDVPSLMMIIRRCSMNELLSNIKSAYEEYVQVKTICTTSTSPDTVQGLGSVALNQRFKLIQRNGRDQ